VRIFPTLRRLVATGLGFFGRGAQGAMVAATTGHLVPGRCHRIRSSGSGSSESGVDRA
jgi:hypothetical protein